MSGGEKSKSNQGQRAGQPPVASRCYRQAVARVVCRYLCGRTISLREKVQERHMQARPSTGVLEILNVRCEVERDTFLVCQPFQHVLGAELCRA
jgi:hypothetical protein